MEEKIASPFAPASAGKRNLKLLLWGSWGTGKTTIALQFPNPAVFDLDGGAEIYGGKYQFEILRTGDLVRVKNALVWLTANQDSLPYQTLVIDPITVYYELLKKYWSDTFSRRNAGSKANKIEFYDMGPKEYNTVRADFRRLFDRLADWHGHLVVTARETEKLKAEGGTFVSAGVGMDCAKELPYFFDTILHLTRRETAHLCMVERDRTGALPEGKMIDLDFPSLAAKLGVTTTTKKEKL